MQTEKNVRTKISAAKPKSKCIFQGNTAFHESHEQMPNTGKKSEIFTQAV
jgi:hypothetical protein